MFKTSPQKMPLAQTRARARVWRYVVVMKRFKAAKLFPVDLLLLEQGDEHLTRARSD